MRMMLWAGVQRQRLGEQGKTQRIVTVFVGIAARSDNRMEILCKMTDDETEESILMALPQ